MSGHPEAEPQSPDRARPTDKGIALHAAFVDTASRLCGGSGGSGAPWEEDPVEVSLLCKGCAGDVGQWMGRKSTKPQCGDGQIASMIHDMFMEGEQRGCVCVWGGGGPHLALEQLRAAKRAGTLAVDYPTEQATTGGLTGTAARPMRSDIVSSRSGIVCVQ